MMKTEETAAFEQPAWARDLFDSTRSAWLWLIVRLYLGYEWFEAGLHKVEDPRWVDDGSALLGYWQRAVAVPSPPGRAAITYDWYRSFLQLLIDGQTHVWFAKLIAYGELLVGVALVLGMFTGIAAFAGALMNMNFMLAGSASSNPVLFTLAVGSMLAWKVAGNWGLDRWVLPFVGTPWHAGRIAAGRRTGPPIAPAAPA
jgi:thiosulfate dehydrogenase [quinone] large subunit